eukprot:1584113-Amphidinium_carterae.1
MLHASFVCCECVSSWQGNMTKIGNEIGSCKRGNSRMLNSQDFKVRLFESNGMVLARAKKTPPDLVKHRHQFWPSYT